MAKLTIESFKYRFLNCIANHVFFDNYFDLDSVSNCEAYALQQIDFYSDPRNIRKMKSELDLEIKRKFFNKNNVLILKEVTKFRLGWEQDLKSIREFKKNKGRRYLLKPTLLILGFLNYFDKKNDKKSLRELFCLLENNSSLDQLIKDIFKKYSEDIYYPKLSNSQTSSKKYDLKRLIFQSFKVRPTDSKKIEAIENIAKKFSISKKSDFHNYVTYGNRHLKPLDVSLFIDIFSTQDRREGYHYLYLDNAQAKEELFCESMLKIQSMKNK